MRAKSMYQTYSSNSCRELIHQQHVFSHIALPIDTQNTPLMNNSQLMNNS